MAPWLAALLGLLLWCLAALWPAWAQQADIPTLQARVTDTTGTLSADAVQQLTAALAGLEQR